MNQPIKMLSLDDKSLSTNLDRAGYKTMGVTVLTAASYKEAEGILGKKAIDVVVINLDFTAIDTLLICKSLKEHPTHQQIPIVVTTVQQAARVQSKVLGAGADLVVEQPIPRTFFIEKIKSLLSQKVRSSARVDWDFFGKATIKIGSKSMAAEIGDLSSTGVLVRVAKELPEHERIHISFSLPNGAGKVAAEAEVVRLVPLEDDPEKNGYGIRFLEFDQDCEDLLTSFVAANNLDDHQIQYYL